MEWFLLLMVFVNYILSFGLVGLWTIRLSAGAKIEYSSRSHAEDMTITNVIIKTLDRKLDWGVNDIMPGSDGLGIWWFQKRCQLRFWLWARQSSWRQRDAHLLGQLVKIWLWARPVQLGATGCMARLLSQTLGWAVQQGLVVGNVGTVSIVKIVSLSPHVEKLNTRS